MLPTIHSEAEPPYEIRIRQMVDRLYADFDSIPARTIGGAINAARRSLAEDGPDAEPEDIEILARWLLDSDGILTRAGAA